MMTFKFHRIYPFLSHPFYLLYFSLYFASSHTLYCNTLVLTELVEKAPVQGHRVYCPIFAQMPPFQEDFL